MKKISLIVVLMLLIGCQPKEVEAKPVSYSCEFKTKTAYGDIVSLVTLAADEAKDVVEQFTIKNTVPFSEDDDISELEKVASELKKTHENIEGLTYTQVFSKDNYTDTLTVDLAKADQAKLVELKLLTDVKEKIDYVSLTKTLENYGQSNCQKR